MILLLRMVLSLSFIGGLTELGIILFGTDLIAVSAMLLSRSAIAEPVPLCSSIEIGGGYGFKKSADVFCLIFCSCYLKLSGPLRIMAFSTYF